MPHLSTLALLAAVASNVNVSSDPSNRFNEPVIAIERRAPRYLVAAANQPSGSAQMLYASSDSGATWSGRPMALGSALFQTDAGVAWDAAGVAYASALGCNATSCDVMVVKSLDKGATWSSAPLVVHSAPGNDKLLVAADDSPSSACRDTVCVTWNDVRGGSLIDLHVACATRGEPPWRDTIVATGALFAPTPAFGPDGELVVAWQNLGTPSIDVARSGDCGRNWAATATISDLAYTLDLGIPAMCSRRALIYTSIDIDRGNGPRHGFVYAVWVDAAPGSTCPWNRCETGCSSDVRFAHSSDGGQDWSPSQLVHTNGPGVDQFNPWLAVDDFDGSVHVAWYDTRDDPARLATHVYYRRSIDGGLTWDPEIRVTTAATDETGPTADPIYQYGDHNGLAVSQCQAHAVWTDRRDSGSEQIFTARIVTQPPPNDIGNTLSLTKGGAANPRLSWTDLGADESNYRIHRGRGPDFATNPPFLAGSSGGADTVVWTDSFSPLAPGAWLYKVRAVGPCGLELTSW